MILKVIGVESASEWPDKRRRVVLKALEGSPFGFNVLKVPERAMGLQGPPKLDEVYEVTFTRAADGATARAGAS